MQFSYLMPTKVVFGIGCIAKHKTLFEALGKKTLIVTGKKSAKITGALNDVCKTLEQCGIDWAIFDRVEPNPSIENVRAGALVAINECADFVIGIGGGSPLDAAKAIAVLSKNDLDDSSLFMSGFSEKPLPVVAVPTTAGTGSEVTQYAILTDIKAKTKKNLSSEHLFPVAAFLDPSYTKTLPFEITVNTAIDAFCHSVESYLSKRSTEMSSVGALRSLSFLGHCLAFLEKNKTIDVDIREKLLYGSMLGGVAIAQTGTTVVHAMGYSLTFFKNIDHGKANGLLLCEFLKYAQSENSGKIQKILNSLGMDELRELELLFNKLLGTPGILSDEEIKVYAEMAVSAKSIPNTVPEPSYDDIVSIYHNSLGR